MVMGHNSKWGLLTDSFCIVGFYWECSSRSIFYEYPIMVDVKESSAVWVIFVLGGPLERIMKYNSTTFFGANWAYDKVENILLMNFH